MLQHGWTVEVKIPRKMCYFSTLVRDANLMFALADVPEVESQYIVSASEDCHIIGCSGWASTQQEFEFWCNFYLSAAQVKADELAQAIERAKVQGL